MPKIKNRERLRRRLLALPPAIRNEIKPALEAGATEITELQYSLVPHDTGLLRSSIDWGYGEPPIDSKLGSKGDKTGPEGKAANDLKVSIWAGSFEAYYARWVEFGTHARAAGPYRDTKGHKRNAGATGHRATPAQPFFFGPYRALRKKVFAKISAATNKAIKDAARVS